MGLISPETGGLRLPKKPVAIEREAAPAGFEWSGGVLRPVAKAPEGIIMPTGEDVVFTATARAESEREDRAAAQLVWKELGIGKGVFLMPDRFDLLNRLFQAIARRNGSVVPFDKVTLQEYLYGGMHTARGSETFPQYTDAELSGMHTAAANLYRAFSAEFRASASAQEAFFSGLFFLSKLEQGTGGYTPKLLELLVAEFGSLDRNRSAYATAKGMLCMYAEHLGPTEAKEVLAVLHKNNDLYTDLGFLLWDANPPAKEWVQPHDGKVFQLPARELAENPERYASLAFNLPPKLDANPGSRIGFEVEVMLQAGHKHLEDPELETEAYATGVVAHSESSQDVNLFEFRSKDGGMEWTPEQALNLIRFGSVLQKSAETVSIASVHINLDSKGMDGIRPFAYRKILTNRAEMQDIARPSPRLSTPYLNEMTMLIDQTQVLRELSYIPTDEIEKEFIARLSADGMPSVRDFFEGAGSRLMLQFLIELAQDAGKLEMVPALLRLHARSALPKAGLLDRLTQVIFDNDAGVEPIPYNDQIRNFFVSQYLPVEHVMLARRLRLSLDEYRSVMESGSVDDDARIELIRGLRTPIPIQQALEFMRHDPLIGESLQEFLTKLGPVPYSDDTINFLTDRRLSSIIRESFIKKNLQKVSFVRIEPILRDFSIPEEIRNEFAYAVSELEPTSAIAVFLEDKGISEQTRWSLKNALRKNAEITRNAEAA